MNREHFDETINELIERATALIPEKEFPELPPTSSAPGVPDWRPFEIDLWDIGEAIRRLVLAEKKQLNDRQTEAVCRICLEKRAKRGRQSFILLLGKKRFLPYAAIIAPLLEDAQLCGQVIQTLYKMGASQYAAGIRPLLNSGTAWIRNEAKRYLSKFG